MVKLVDKSTNTALPDKGSGPPPDTNAPGAGGPSGPGGASPSPTGTLPPGADAVADLDVDALTNEIAELPSHAQASVASLQAKATPGMVLKALHQLRKATVTIEKPVDLALQNGKLVPASEAGPDAIAFSRARLQIYGREQVGYCLELHTPDSPFPRTFSIDQSASHPLVRDLLAQMTDEQRAQLTELPELERRIAPLAPGELRLVTPSEVEVALAADQRFDIPDDLSMFDDEKTTITVERLTLRLSQPASLLGSDGYDTSSLSTSLNEPSTPTTLAHYDAIVAKLRALESPPPHVQLWLADLDDRAEREIQPEVVERVLVAPLDTAWDPEKSTLVPAGTEGAIALRALRIPLVYGPMAVETSSGMMLQVDRHSPTGRALLGDVLENQREMLPSDPEVQALLYEHDLSQSPAPSSPTVGVAGDPPIGFVRLPVTHSDEAIVHPSILRTLRSLRPRDNEVSSAKVVWADLSVPADARNIGRCMVRLMGDDGSMQTVRYGSAPLAYRKQIAAAIRNLSSDQVPPGHPVAPVVEGLTTLDQTSIVATEHNPANNFGGLMAAALGKSPPVAESKLVPASSVTVPFSALPAWAAKKIYDPNAKPEKNTFASAVFGRGRVDTQPMAVTVKLVLDADAVIPADLTAIDETGVHHAIGRAYQMAVATAAANFALAEIQRTKTPLTQHPALRAYENFRADKWRFAHGPKPEAPHAQIVWRAAQVDRADRESIEKSIEAEYGLRPRNWVGYINDIRELPIAESLVKAADMHEGITPSFLYVVAIGEGFNGVVTGSQRGLNDTESPRTVDGFGALGIDFFGAEAPRLRKRGYLPADFQEGTHYASRGATNEKGESTTTAVINASENNTAIDNALIATAAVVAERRDWVLKNGRRILGEERVNGWSDAELNYVVYATFNAGQAFGLKYMTYLKKHPDKSPVREWTGEDFGSSSRKVHYNTALRIGTWDFLRQLGIFEDVE